MSTKATIYFGDNFHFYTDCFDEENLYLELEGVEFSSSPGGITIQIPIPIWEVIKNFSAINLSDASRTDEEIQKEAEDFVHERVRKVKELQEQGHTNPMYAICGIGVYGSVDTPPDEQIKRGVKHLTERREKQQKLIQKVGELEKNQRK